MLLSKMHIPVAVMILTFFGVGIGYAMEPANDTKDDQEEFALATSAKVSWADAIRKTEAAYPHAKIVSAELEKEDGRLVYDFELLDDKAVESESSVDAMTGEVFVEKD